MTASLRTFIARCVPSFLAWDLVLLFGSSPQASLGVEDIREHMAVGPAALEAELETLGAAGLLERRGETWRLTGTPQTLEELGMFMNAVEDKKGRLQVLTYFLETQQEH